MDTPILLLDEPFASIDENSRYELIKLLAELRDLGKTIILCDHDLSGYEHMVDQVVTLSNNELSQENLSILSNKPTITLSKSKTNQTGLLKLEKFSYSQGKRTLLSPTDYTFNKGITTITGDNGVGKSTLLSAIVQQQKYQGNMFLSGTKMKRRKSLYQEVTLAVQDATHQFVQLTPKEELAFNIQLNEEQQKKQMAVLEELGIIDKLEGSLFHLSEGQKKMIQLTTMLTLERKLLLLDEPFTGLDEKACRIFMDWMLEKSKEQSFIIVSHRLAPLSGHSDYHVSLKNKQLNFVGETSQREGEKREYSQNQYA
jgi:energy-coupling factor transport system ATP-binding protein